MATAAASSIDFSYMARVGRRDIGQLQQLKLYATQHKSGQLQVPLARLESNRTNDLIKLFPHLYNNIKKYIKFILNRDSTSY